MPIFGQNKWALYIALNLLLSASLMAGSALGGGSLAELPYVAVLFALCSMPIVWIDRLNGPFAILGVAMTAYFGSFGALDAVSMFSPPAREVAKDGVLDLAEVVILAGALMQLIGFYVAARKSNYMENLKPVKDLPPRLLLPLGLLLWTLGSAANLYQSLVVQVGNSNAVVVAGFSALGLWNTTGLILIGHYVGPLGILILGYWWSVSRDRFSTIFILAIVIAQFCVGWIEDSKETALEGLLVVLLTRFLVRGKLPLRWMIGTVVGITLMFPVMTAKRAIMTEGLNMTRAQALSHTAEIFWRAVADRDAAREGKYQDKTQTFLERLNVKPSIELFVDHIGKDRPYMLGSTLEPLLYVFIPRLVWSDKPSDNSAQTFNREFHLSEDWDTFMSPSHLGEMYWNFGTAGVVLGQFFVGALLGFVFSRFDPSTRPSLTRVLVVTVTLYQLVARTEGQIEIQYVLWLRTLVLVGILHWLVARRSDQMSPDAATVQSDHAVLGQAPSRFPNLLR
jgi:hypothetical protein